MTPQDKSKPVSLAVKVHPQVFDLARQIGKYLNDSSLDHVVSEAIRDAAKDRGFLDWQRTQQDPTEVPKARKGAA